MHGDPEVAAIYIYTRGGGILVSQCVSLSVLSCELVHNIVHGSLV